MAKKKTLPASNKDGNKTPIQLLKLMGAKAKKIVTLAGKIKALKSEIKELKKQIRRQL